MAAAIICAAYVALIAPLTAFPMQDYPNHVARAAIMADILFHHGVHFGRFFEVHLTAVPYVLPDLILTGAVDVFGPNVGAGLFTSIVLLSLPAALLFYAHVIRLPWNARLFALMMGVYLSTDWFFQMGFFAFRLAVALFVVNLATTELLRRRWSAPRFAAHVAVIAAGYLTHLSAPIFMGVATGVTGSVQLWFRTTTVRREIYLLAPIAPLLALYVETKTSLDHILGSWSENLATPGVRHLLGAKIRNLPGEFIGFDWHLAWPPLLAFAALLLSSARRHLARPDLGRPAVIEQLALAAAFVGIYFILPGSYADADYVDVRALPIITLGLLLACLRLADADSNEHTFASAWSLPLAILFAAANLVYVIPPLMTNDAWIERYRAIVAAIPPDSYVLSIKTDTARQHLNQIGAFGELDRDAITPYLFNGDEGDPMTYFNYRHRPYAPDSQWYKTRLHLRRPDTPDAAVVDWQRVSCDYSYLLLTIPYDTRLIDVPTTPIASNEAAALLAIDKRACRRNAS